MPTGSCRPTTRMLCRSRKPVKARRADFAYKICSHLGLRNAFKQLLRDMSWPLPAERCWPTAERYAHNWFHLLVQSLIISGLGVTSSMDSSIYRGVHASSLHATPRWTVAASPQINRQHRWTGLWAWAYEIGETDVALLLNTLHLLQTRKIRIHEHKITQ